MRSYKKTKKIKLIGLVLSLMLSGCGTRYNINIKNKDDITMSIRTVLSEEEYEKISKKLKNEEKIKEQYSDWEIGKMQTIVEKSRREESDEGYVYALYETISGNQKEIAGQLSDTKLIQIGVTENAFFLSNPIESNMPDINLEYRFTLPFAVVRTNGAVSEGDDHTVIYTQNILNNLQDKYLYAVSASTDKEWLPNPNVEIRIEGLKTNKNKKKICKFGNKITVLTSEPATIVIGGNIKKDTYKYSIKYDGSNFNTGPGKYEINVETVSGVKKTIKFKVKK